MMWMAWRQHRRLIIMLAIVVAAIAAYFLVTGIIEYADYYRVVGGTNVAQCQQLSGQPDGGSALCANLTNTFYSMHMNLAVGLIGPFLLPLLLGMFLGAPLLAREFERGTFRLAWVQSVTRSRWLWVEVAVVAGIAMCIVGAFIPLVLWWHAPASTYNALLGSPLFSMEGILPLAYAAFALALGIAAGAVLRHVLPAMFITLVVYAVVTLLIYNFGRPNFLPPRVVTWDPYVTGLQYPLASQDWQLYFGFVNVAGDRVDGDMIYATCAPSGYVYWDAGSDFTRCVHDHGWLQSVAWQPADRFWPLQLIETGILAVLTAALLGLTVWLVRRRMA